MGYYLKRVKRFFLFFFILNFEKRIVVDEYNVNVSIISILYRLSLDQVKYEIPRD